MKQIYVALMHAGRQLPVGVIRFDEERQFGYFAYLSNYDGPPLDPVNLDYRKPMDPKDRRRKSERVFLVNSHVNPGLMHSVFVDAMPGQWGMQVLAAEYPEIRQMRDAERLYWMGARTTGALSFFLETAGEERTVKGLDELEAVRAKCAEFLAKLKKMGLDGVRNPAVASHGGVMPKAAYEDASGRHWIAKFDRPGEGTQYGLLEHLAHTMARKAGVDTPETRALNDGMGGHMFLTERYDRSASGRFHKVSFMSLLDAKEAGAGDYRDVFRALRQVASEAAWPQQRDELLRRMALNIGLNVTDDHLRNHEIRLMGDGSWELSPAFDLVPVSGPSPHQCSLFGQPRADLNLEKPATLAFWSRVAQELAIEESHVLGVVAGVGDSIRKEWPALVEQSGMNRFNQMQALMAAEVGCGTPFPSFQAATQPMTPDQRKEVAEAARLLDIGRKVLAGASGATDVAAKVAAALRKLNDDAPRLAQALRLAGHKDAADAMLMAPLSAAAHSVMDPTHRPDGLTLTELEECSARIHAVVKPAQSDDSAKSAAARRQ